MNADEVVLYGVSGLALVMLLVQAAKVAGLPDKWAPLTALVSGFAVAGAVIANEFWPADVGPYIRWVILALMLGLGGSGLYAHTQATQAVVDKRNADRILANAPEGAQTVVVPSTSVPAVGVAVDTGATTRLNAEDVPRNLTGENVVEP